MCQFLQPQITSSIRPLVSGRRLINSICKSAVFYSPLLDSLFRFYRKVPEGRGVKHGIKLGTQISQMKRIN